MAEWVLKGSLKGPQGDPGEDASADLDGLNITADEVQQWWDEWEGDGDGE